MGATISEISVFETLLGVKQVEDLKNNCQYISSAIQRDLGVLKQNKLEIEHSPVEKRLAFIYTVTEPLAFDDHKSIVEKLFPSLAEFLPDPSSGVYHTSYRQPVMGRVSADGKYWYGYYLTVGDTKVFAGVKANLR